MSKISELSDGGVVQGGDTLIAVRSGGNVKVTYGGSTTANIDGGTIDDTVIGGTTPAAVTTTALVATTSDINGGTIDGTVIGGTTAAAGTFTTGQFDTSVNVDGTVTADGLTVDGDANFDSGTLFVDASANAVGIGTSSPASKLDVNGDVTITDKIIHSGDTNTAIRFPAADTVTVETAGTEAMRIDSSGRFLLGTTASRGNNFNTTNQNFRLQVEGLDYLTGGASFTANTNSSSNGPHIVINRTRGTTVGSNTIVQNGDRLGLIGFQGSDGTEFVSAAFIDCAVDGTPDANDMPGRIVFGTTANGSASPTERLRITSAGNVGIGTSSPVSRLEVSNTNTSADAAGPIVTLTNESNAVTTANIALGTIDFHSNDPSSGGAGSGGTIAVLSERPFDGGPANTYMRFSTRATSTVAEAMRIDSSGHLIVPEGITLGTAAGTYNAANTLDDYEEGTWDCSVVGQTATSEGRYVKIGDLVYVEVKFTCDTDVTATDRSDVIQGFPFSASNTTRALLIFFGSNLKAASGFGGAPTISSSIGPTNVILSGTSNGAIVPQSSTNGNAFYAQNIFDDTSSFRLTGSYRIA